MKNILCYGDSNTWGYIAGTMNSTLLLGKRFDFHTRWTGLLQMKLGNNYHVIEEGLNSRTTAHDETWISRTSRNGLKDLPLILEMHYPLNYVVFMLGTNDLKKQFNLSAKQITQGMHKLIQLVKNSHFGPDFFAPRIILIAPSPIFTVNDAAMQSFYDENSALKSQELGKYFEELAHMEQCAFLNAGEFVRISPLDGIHLDEQSQEKLAMAIFEKIKSL